MKLRTRFAPTPSGYLHLGNAWSLLLTWLAARHAKGSIHLRIDDLDAARSRDEYLEDIFATLEWLGLDWDSGPRNAAEFKSGFSQRLRMNRYQQILNQMQSSGKVYACVCSREQTRRDSEASGLAVYAGTCRHKGLDFFSEDNTEEHPPIEKAWRFRISKDAVKVRDEHGGGFDLHPHRDMGDFVLRQKNGDPSYQLASLIDDVDLNINFIVRGLDLIPSTGAQMGLAKALGLETFSQARFWHHALVLDDAGEKLSKSKDAMGYSIMDTACRVPATLKHIREKFPDPLPIYRFFARHLEIEPGSISSLHDLLAAFRIEKVATMPLKLSDFLLENG